MMLPELPRDLEKDVLNNPEKILVQLVENHGTAVSMEEIYRGAMGYGKSGLLKSWYEAVRGQVDDARELLLPGTAIYSIDGYGMYVLREELAVGDIFIPGGHLEELNEACPSDDFLPLVNYCRQVKVKNGKRVRPRLTQIGAMMMKELIEAYTYSTGFENIYARNEHYDSSNSMIQSICSLRKILQEPELGGVYSIVVASKSNELCEGDISRYCLNVNGDGIDELSVGF